MSAATCKAPPPPLPRHPALVTDACFGDLKQYVIATTGLSYYSRRDQELANHFAGRFRETGTSDCRTYLQLLQTGPSGKVELDQLIESLTIGETYFFRHPQLFDHLETSILPDVIARNQPHRRLRIWSAGASIGAEAYSVAILLRLRLAHLITGWDVTILGTDINRSFLARAAAAAFEDWALRGVADEIKQQCFSRCGDVWKLNPEFQAGVSFQYHNLVEHPFPSMLHNLFAFDVVLCRNVMIYFGEREIAGIVCKMRDSLVNGGWLLVGHAEHGLDRYRDFRTVAFAGATAYQRDDGRHQPAVGPAPSCTVSSPVPSIDRPRSRQPPSEAMPPAANGPDDLAHIRHLADRGEIEREVTRCEGLLTVRNLDPACHLHYALLLAQLGRHSACEQALRRAIYLDRNYILAHYYLGLTMQRLGRHAEASRSWHNTRRQLAALPPDFLLNDADGLTVAELSEITRMHLGTIP